MLNYFVEFNVKVQSISKILKQCITMIELIF